MRCVNTTLIPLARFLRSMGHAVMICLERLDNTAALLLSCLRRHVVLAQHGGWSLQAVLLRMEPLCTAACGALDHSSMFVTFCLLQQYSTIGHAFLSTFSMLIGGADLDLFYSSHNPVVGVILM